MSRAKLLQTDQSYSFRSYFEMPYEVDDILAEFGYSFEATRLRLPQVAETPPQLVALREDIQQTLELTRLSSETDRREVLVGPVVLAVARWCRCQVRLEYWLQVNEWLKGSLDYLLLAAQHFVVIEAKRDDLQRGFTQLAVELIALAEDRDLARVYGAVTLGDVWRFGELDRDRRLIRQDLRLYPVPEELETVMQIFAGILRAPLVDPVA